jgi:sterol desaturase/sphingolipid hydroxylase (fatty acid hydroxylase superfamily)
VLRSEGCPLLHYVTLVPSFLLDQLAAVLLPPYSPFSALSLFSALCVAILFILLKRRPEKRSVKYRVMLRALFPRWLYRNASFKADVMFFLFNTLAFGALFGWAMFSSSYVSTIVSVTLTDYVGARAGIGWDGFTGKSIATLAIFIAYELAYWLNHYFSHRVPLLWEFHKVHHTAEVLSPLTNFRIHPVYGIVFGNLIALFVGTTDGVLHYLKFGTPFGVGAGGNVVALAFVWILGHLQHSHLWIAVTGPLGRVIVSPAHHQIHHSNDPKHFNKNFGSSLAIWDWIFGTLHIPNRDREDLSFGVGSATPDHHTVVGGMLTPFAMAWRRLRAEP